MRTLPSHFQILLILLESEGKVEKVKEGKRGSPAKRIILGAIIGAIPGGITVLLTVPVSGEAELTLGVGGIFLAIIGLIIGAIIGARKR